MDNGIENPWDSVLADTITYVGIKFHLQLGSCSTSPSHFGQVKPPQLIGSVSSRED
ncbi:hypothetical protein CICLE_v10033286mg [Citrus x clementina]|uniref:Uncharacterized protein n=1 Tax=Citrus clementina TaxID=85681 RepID=V4TF03_CITCL|nr:hypothetical protein CICLE_v10033286mg [Citrus x clementina]